ncbi:tyrosine-type recombinase/integrase [Rhodobacter sp. Har01]|uniref:tyrosine-type recombinase/integrase n=1 Tax=Rhodobacter sp. Har01 TaxID=2883999 RepID=UPI001D08B5CD|nr:tyrosine-type recombinase/integrase [Rhodobacter sp. Har01]MCB6179039.1 tyrosine-type recombinase/integrase [Rhodobacter sp. Har01]
MTIKPRSKKGTLELRRRVPRKYAAVEPRTFVWVSLDTDSPSVAEARAVTIWQQQIARWDALLAGDTTDAEARLDVARELVEAKGFSYTPASTLLEQPVQQLLKRVEAIAVRKGVPSQREAEALLGTVPDPGLKISRALDLFWQLTASDLIGKSEDQVRRAKNPVTKAVRNLIEVIGDKRIDAISRDDMLDFRDWWAERMEKGDLTANSANKDLTHIGKVLKRVNELKRLGLDLPLGGLAFKQGDADQRPPFSREWITTRLLAPGALSGLNTEARCILLGMINTGYRPSEGAALLPTHIQLDGTVPHILIRPEGRQLKTRNAKRTIPLAGVSLQALRECRNGFPRYRDKPGLSATINKFLRENRLMESDDHVVYSLRHSFEDRLLAAGVDERIRRDLMGHALDRERYGSGASLEQAHEIVQRIAL